MMQLLSVQIGQAKPLRAGERSVLSAIGKCAVQGAVAVGRLGLEGDEQVDLSVHGGLEKAVYAYPSEHYPLWRELRTAALAARNTPDLFADALACEPGPAPLAPGSLGENLTLEGLLEKQVWVGDVLEFADCTLRITQPREPCFKLALALGWGGAVREMALRGCCGFYLSVVRPGSLCAGEAFVLQPGPRRVSISERFAAKLFKHLR